MLIRKGRQPVLYLLTAATFIYLIFELSFNATLLDIVGSNPLPDEIDKIQKYGRILSGFAFAIAIWPLLITMVKVKSALVKTTVISVITYAIVFLVYKGEEKFVDYLVEKSSPEKRYSSLHLIGLQKLLISEDLGIKGLDISHNDIQKPDGKTFLATFPFVLASVKDIHIKIMKEKPAIIRRLIDYKYGGYETLYKHYTDSEKKIKSLYYDSYIPAIKKADASYSKAVTKYKEAWDEYIELLKKKGINPYDIPEELFPKIVKEVQKRGIPVPDDWDPHDRDMFEAAINLKTEKIQGEIEKKFTSASQKQYGVSLPRGLSLDQFLLHPAIQGKWKDALHLPKKITLYPGMSKQQFRKLVYEPVLDIKQSEMLSIYNSDIRSFADGNKFETIGKSNMRAMIVPPIALFFSMLGLFIHILKITAFMLQIITGYTIRFKTLILIVIAFFMFVVFNIIPLSKITKQDIFANYLLPLTSRQYSMPVACAIRGTIHMQTVVYPISSKVRNITGLFDYKEPAGDIKDDNLKKIVIKIV